MAGSVFVHNLMMEMMGILMTKREMMTMQKKGDDFCQYNDQHSINVIQHSDP